MKSLIKEEIVFLIINIFILCGVYIINLPVWLKAAILFVIIPSAIYFSRHVIILPIDLIEGKKEKELIYTRMRGVYRFEFSTVRRCVLGFYDGKSTIYLDYPETYNNKQNIDLLIKMSNTKMDIVYYKHSKILLDWKIKNIKNEQRTRENSA